MRIKQPLRLKFNGTKFIRIRKYVDHGGGISEGPWYQQEGQNRIFNQDVWLPDLNFTHGSAKVPFAMHYLPGVRSDNT